MTHYEQAQRYIAAIPGAVSGNGGHSQTYTVAVALAHGFALSEDDALSLLQEYNQTCQPQWSERELRHKIAEAIAKPHDKPRGHLCGKSATPMAPRPRMATVKPEPATRERRYALNPETRLPDPLPDGARALLLAAFREGEGVRICHATFNEEGHEIPRDGGVSLSREGWLQRLDKHGGDPNGIFWTATDPKPGIYITVNPMKVGGASDSDVTGFRHCLVEFDSISKAEQFNLYEQSRLPCTAIISSGGKSVHAWVKVDARDRREYDERVQTIYKHFEAYGLDAKNKNPSRFSRLPNCVRLTSRQELLALNTGCESFSEWIKEQEYGSLPKAHKMSDLLGVDTSNDPGCVIGFRDGRTLRYLCKGKSAWIIGPSGIGKSSLMSEFSIGWALGKPVYGIAPAKPLKSLIIQAENDFYDLAEMAQGIARAYNISADLNEFEHEVEYQQFQQIDQNVIFVTETTSINEHFVDRLHRLIDQHKPDIVWIDPLLSFAGIDVAKQDQCSMFLRTLLNPVLEATGVVMIGIHHTGKPKGSKETASWTAIDHAYSGIGSSELVNWARAVMVLRPIDDIRYELKLAKRGGRAGAVHPPSEAHPEGEWAFSSVYLQHAQKGIRWEQIPPPEEGEADEEKKERPVKLSKVETLANTNLHDVLSRIPDAGETANALGKRFEAHGKKVGKSLSLTKCRTDLLDLLITRKKIRFDDVSELYFKGENV